jgi:N-acetylglucosaminyldiphosphoundecaprenol N-acetyl-beta-D-mannosaminyltransferase
VADLVARPEVSVDVEPSPVPYEMLFGLAFCKLSLDDMLEELGRRAEQRRGTVVMTCNVDHVVLRSRDTAFAAAYAEAHLVTADGAPLVAFSRLVRRRLPERVTGADLVARLPEVAARKGLRVALVGGAPGVAADAAARLAAESRGMPEPMACETPMRLVLGSREDEALVARLQEYDPHVVVVCLGSPKQEVWIHHHRDDLPAAVLLGGGAALDFVVGRQRRAPRWVQRGGVEWVWRLSHDFRRLARRYLVQDAAFVPIAARELAAVAGGRFRTGR